MRRVSWADAGRATRSEERRARGGGSWDVGQDSPANLASGAASIERPAKGTGKRARRCDTDMGSRFHACHPEARRDEGSRAGCLLGPARASRSSPTRSFAALRMTLWQRLPLLLLPPPRRRGWESSYPSSWRTSSAAAASASARPAGFLPPAVASFGRPPPPPPTLLGEGADELAGLDAARHEVVGDGRGEVRLALGSRRPIRTRRRRRPPPPAARAPSRRARAACPCRRPRRRPWPRATPSTVSAPVEQIVEAGGGLLGAEAGDRCLQRLQVVLEPRHGQRRARRGAA